MMMRLRSILLTVLAASLAHAKVVTHEVKYNDANVECVGYLAFDDAAKGKQPGVIVVPEWWGLNDYASGRGSLPSWAASPSRSRENGHSIDFPFSPFPFSPVSSSRRITFSEGSPLT